MTADKAVLVLGATGNQGGAVARALLGTGRRVRAFVRDPHTPAAAELARLGAELAVGDLDRPQSVRVAARDVHGIFSAQAVDPADPRPETEVRQGKSVIDAAVAEGVEQVVYSSIAAYRSGVPHFDTKAVIEQYLDSAGLPATVIRPVFFMENWRYLLPKSDDNARIGSVALDVDTRLQMVAVADIGRIVADAFARPDEYIGEKLEIAGDELTVRQIAAACTEADGVPTRVVRPDRLPPAVADMFAWLDEHGYRTDITALRRRFPQLLTFETWLRTEARPAPARTGTAS
ncbi:NmrA/HSCARG family protein [Nocardia wallacei]|uniref:NmrA/HSCARG family protein n=1 Tax=Nocardia wallacei TaxID=480035 RepID=UPI002457750C|nr:NmrA/HSCARG family protein [Nocardia wallacei]